MTQVLAGDAGGMGHDRSPAGEPARAARGVLDHPQVVTLLDRLDGRRDAFLDDASAAVRALILGKSTPACLGLVARDAHGVVVAEHPASASAGYAAALLAFCLKRPYGGHRLDSVLTDEIVAIYQARYEEFLGSGRDELSSAMMAALAADPAVANALVDAVTKNKALTTLTAEMRKALRDQLLHALTQKVAANPLAEVVAAKVGAVTTAVVSSQVAAAVINKLLIAYSHQLSVLIAKALAMPAVKAAIAAAVKKVVFAAVAASFLKIVAAKVGAAGVGVAAAMVVVPLLAWFLYRQWTRFPQKLAESVPAALRAEMRASFRITNEKILGEIWDHLVSRGVKDFELDLAGDPEFAEAVSLVRKTLDKAL